MKLCTILNPGEVGGPGALKFEVTLSSTKHNRLALLFDTRAEKGIVAFYYGYVRRTSRVTK